MSGGCVEGAVYELGQEVRDSGRPVLQRYGVSDDDAFAVGLTCGGIIDIFVEPVDRDSRSRARRRRGRHRGRPSRSPSPPSSPAPTAPASAGGWSVAGRGRAGRSARSAPSGWTTPSPTTPAGCSARAAPAMLHYGPDGERRGDELRSSSQSFAPPPRMLVFGAIDFAAAVARVGSVPRLPGHRVRRPAGVRHRASGSPTPTRWSSSGRTATSRRGGSRTRRRAHGDLRAHPRPEVRRAAAGGRAAHWTWPTSARWAPGAPTTTGWSGCARPA